MGALDVGKRLSVVLAASALPLAAACQGGQAAGDAGPLPAEIYGMELVAAQSGADAVGVLERDHGSDVASKADNYVGHYGTEEMGAVVYLSRFATADEAQAELDTMSDAIGRGSSGFGHHIQFRAASKPVHITFGHGRVHYFWEDDVDLIWLTVNDAAMARQVLAEMLDTSPDSIPTFEELISGRPAPETGS